MRPLSQYPFVARPMIAAHRGDTSLGARENTIEAIAPAIISGADMIEVDVQLSSDGVFVCYHDEKLSDGRRIWELDSPTLQDAGVSRLSEILDVAAGKVYFNLEVKEYSARDPKTFMSQLVAMVEQRRLQDSVLLSSFRIDYIREAGWHMATTIIRPDDHMQAFFNSRAFGTPIVFEKPMSEYLPSELLALSRATGYACSIDEMNSRDREDIERHNLFLSVYTITTDDEFNTALELGAQGLVCENPRHFAELRNALFPSSPEAP